MLPELHQLLQWSYTQAPGHGSNEEFSWIHHKHRHHHAPFSDLSEDIRAFMNQLKAVFLTKFYCLMTQLRGSATLSPCHIKSWEWVKKQNIADFDEGTMLGSKKVDNTRQKNINYDPLLLG